jgi:hypothetical protein
LIHDKNGTTDVISTSNPLNINVITQNIAAAKLATPKSKKESFIFFHSN